MHASLDDRMLNAEEFRNARLHERRLPNACYAAVPWAAAGSCGQDSLIGAISELGRGAAAVQMRTAGCAFLPGAPSPLRQAGFLGRLIYAIIRANSFN
jgi:hypothetical protein